MTTANEVRGEFDIELGGGTYTLRPSWEAIDAFERATGRSLIELAGDAARRALSTRSMAVIIVQCVAAYGREKNLMSAQGWDVDRTMGLIQEADGGSMLLCERLKLILYMAATGGLTASGEARPSPAAKPAPETSSEATPTRAPRKKSVGA